MRALNVLFTKLAGFFAMMRRSADFTCGDCDRWEHCGLPPNKDCIHRLEQIARNEGRPAIRAPLPLW